MSRHQWGPEDEAKHPRDRDGQWAEKLSARLPGGSIYDTLTSAEFGDPSEQQQAQAEQWAAGLQYTDHQSGIRSVVSGVEHAGDGFSANGRFVEGDQTVGGWSVAVLHSNTDAPFPMVEVEEIWLADPMQGQGIARRWVRRLEGHARQSGAQQVEMWDQSGGFWEHLGYVRASNGMGVKQL